VLTCSRCGGRLRLIGAVEDPDAIRASRGSERHCAWPQLKAEFTKGARAPSVRDARV